MIQRPVTFTALLIAFLLAGTAVRGQSADTLFTLEEFLTNVELYHPIAQQAGLQTERARAEMLLARGGLDPEITADWNQKNFDDKLYYQIYRGKLRVPTVLGLDVVAGYENTSGVFLNPENKTDEQGLWNVGVEVNVLQGLIVNERRIALDRAKVLQDLAENEWQIALNEVLFDAGNAYVDWQKYYYYGIVLDSNVVLAQTYSDNTRTSYENGEYTAMDTLEAFILLQDALTQVQKNAVMLTKARQMMENYLWFDGTPLELQPGIAPAPFVVGIPSLNIDPNVNLVTTNPLIMSYVNKQAVYEIEQRLKREKLKPKLKVKYNPLLATEGESVRPNYSMSDYKWGFDFSTPLLLRTARAEVQLGQIKIRENAFLLQSKQNELTNKLQASVTMIDQLREQVALTEANVDRYRVLLEGENIKFLYGESSVFLLNKRQEKYIEAQLKLIELRSKIRLELLNYRYLSNDLITR